MAKNKDNANLALIGIVAIVGIVCITYIATMSRQAQPAGLDVGENLAGQGYHGNDLVNSENGGYTPNCGGKKSQFSPCNADKECESCNCLKGMCQ